MYSRISSSIVSVLDDRAVHRHEAKALNRDVLNSVAGYKNTGKTSHHARREHVYRLLREHTGWTGDQARRLEPKHPEDLLFVSDHAFDAWLSALTVWVHRHGEFITWKDANIPKEAADIEGHILIFARADEYDMRSTATSALGSAGSEARRSLWTSRPTGRSRPPFCLDNSSLQNRSNRLRPGVWPGKLGFVEGGVNALGGIGVLLSMNEMAAELSYAYLHAVASRAGFACEIAGRQSDRAGIDARLHIKERLAPNAAFTDFPIEVQLKATSRTPVLRNEHYSYWLKSDHYDKLRNPGVWNLRLLVVLFLPEDQSQWLMHDEDGMVTRKVRVLGESEGGQPER